MAKIHKGDEVIVLTGRDKGRRGRVLDVLHAENRLLVEGVNVYRKHQKPNPQMQIPGGIVDKTLPIHVSNVAIFNPATKKADRVGYQMVMETVAGQQKLRRHRIFRSSGERIA